MTESIEHHLPRGTPIVNPFRMQHGDLTGDVSNGNIKNIHSSKSTIADVLMDRGFIEPHHHAALMIFIDLRRAYEASQGVKWANGQVGSPMDGLRSGDALMRYDLIRHEMGVPKCERILRVCIEAARKEFPQAMPTMVSDAYRTSIEKLVKAMEAVSLKL